MLAPDEFRSAGSRNPLFSTSQGNIAYPDPFFDIASTYLPRSVKSLFLWCDRYYRTNPLINAIITKLAEYPVTDIIIETPNEEVRKKWEWLLFDHLQYKSFEIGVGIDYHCFGNAVVNLMFPFEKLLTCDRCAHTVTARTTKRLWRYAVDRFVLECPKCGHRGRARPSDHYIAAIERIRLIRRNMMDLEIKYHEESGVTEYLYHPPSDLRTDIVAGKKDVVLDCPQELLEAVRLGTPIRLNPETLYHLRRTSNTTHDQGLGIPVIMPVLKDAYYLQILKKAQEALSLTTIIPLRIFFPQAGGPMQDPIANVNLEDWRNQLEVELRKFRNDPGYTPILPFPVGHQLIGGEGRALLLSQEIRVWSEHIIIGMGYPVSLVFGDVAWSGSSIALRMLENSFLRYIEHRRRLFQFVTRMISRYLRWEVPDYRMKPFKMADDIQRQQISIQLNQMGAVSRQTMLSLMDYDPERESELISEERKEDQQRMQDQGAISARVQGETMLVQAEYQAKAQIVQAQVQQSAGMSGQVNVPGARGGPQGIEAPPPQNPYTGALQGLDARIVPRKLAEQLATLSPEQKNVALEQLRTTHPELHHQILKTLSPPGGTGMRPLPEQLPPRAGPATAMI